MLIENVFTIHEKEMAFLKYIIEGYDGLATISTIKRGISQVSIFVSNELEEELLDIIKRAVKHKYFTAHFLWRVGDP